MIVVADVSYTGSFYRCSMNTILCGHIMTYFIQVSLVLTFRSSYVYRMTVPICVNYVMTGLGSAASDTAFIARVRLQTHP